MRRGEWWKEGGSSSVTFECMRTEKGEGSRGKEGRREGASGIRFECMRREEGKEGGENEEGGVKWWELEV